MNEWYAKDMSRKMRSTLKIKNSQGYAIGRPPLGYLYDEKDKKRWVVDEEGAQILRYIFELRKQGESMNKIAKILKKQKVYIPSVYAAKKGVSKPIAKPPLNEYLWNHGMIQRILTNQSYVGDVVNFKTYSSREPRHASREQIIVLFFSFIARVLYRLANFSIWTT